MATSAGKAAVAFFLLLLFSGCITDTRPLIPKDETNENERNNKLFVFVGEKIEVENMPYEQGNLDEGWKAKYKILQRIYGNYPEDVIEFEAYSHRGTPAFLAYKNVMLFVSEHEGKYYQQKYQYFDVYKTTNGRWAGAYADDDYNRSHGTTVKPEKIEFVREVSYPIKTTDSEGNEMSIYYPEPYFKKVGDRAIAVYGNYTEELFRLKKEGILTARRLFGNNPPDTPLEISLEEIKK